MDMSSGIGGGARTSKESEGESVPLNEWSAATVVGWVAGLGPPLDGPALAEVFEMVGTDGAQLARLTIEDIIEAEEELGISEEDGRQRVLDHLQHPIVDLRDERRGRHVDGGGLRGGFVRRRDADRRRRHRRICASTSFRSFGVAHIRPRLLPSAR